MKSAEDFGGLRVAIISGQYKSKKGFVSRASIHGLYVDLDYKPLRISVRPEQLVVLNDNGRVDKK
tara:strand:- start:385 stop:579 length:195 start_codon:yes stop_codon:yes gene_type:complete